MKLAFSTNAFVRFSVIDAVERIAALGYEGVEILADLPHLYPYSVSESDLEKLAALLDRCGLEVANLNANTAVGYYGRTFWEPLFEPSLANPDEAARKWRVAYSKRCVDLARILGCRNVSLTSGRVVPGSTPENALKHLRESLETVLEYAEHAGVRIGIEYEPGLLVERCEELQALLEAVGSPWLGANLDLGHSHVLGEDPETVIAGLSQRIFNIHLEDIRSQKHYHLIPGLGEMDFARLLEILRRHAYDGFITVELYTYPHEPEAAASESFKYLKPLMSDVKEVSS
jgi:fructoselysine 3-epimerase